MSRIDQINELLKSELANLIVRESVLPDSLITVSFVETTPDLRWAKIGISVLPDKLAGTALKRLRSKSSLFSNILKKKLKMKFIPKFNWVFDSTEKDAEIIEQAVREANQN